MPVPQQALVLTAGLGTRLRPLSDVRAKAALPVACEPIVRRILRWLALHDVSHVVLNLHHLPETIAACIGDGSDLAVSVRYSWEQPRLLGSGGGPRQALPILGADTFLVINGDTLTDVDLNHLAHAHEASRALVTLALVPNVEPLRYGGIRLGPDGFVTGFVPNGPQAEGSYHFIGVQIARAAAFASLEAGRPGDSIRGLYDQLIAANPVAIFGCVAPAAFWDIGTVWDYWTTSHAFLAQEQRAGTATGRNVRVDPSARVTRSILWDDIDIAAGCEIDECIVTDGVRLPRGSRYRQAVITRSSDGRLLHSPMPQPPDITPARYANTTNG